MKNEFSRFSKFSKLWKTAGLPQGAKLLFSLLWFYAGEAPGRLAARPADLADDLAASARSIRRWLAALAALEVIDIVDRPLRGHWRLMIYRPLPVQKPVEETTADGWRQLTFDDFLDDLEPPSADLYPMEPPSADLYPMNREAGQNAEAPPPDTTPEPAAAILETKPPKAAAQPGNFGAAALAAVAVIAQAQPAPPADLGRLADRFAGRLGVPVGPRRGEIGRYIFDALARGCRDTGLKPAEVFEAIDDIHGDPSIKNRGAVFRYRAERAAILHGFDLSGK